jgi:ABC-type uncharacterized transport system fused permease/ATPase subunit
MWSLVKAELFYRWWLTLLVFAIIATIPVINVIFDDKTKVTIALSYLSYPIGFFVFIITVFMQDRIEREYRMSMLARLPLTSKQRALVRFGPILILLSVVILFNAAGYIYLGELQAEVKIWTFISSIGLWAIVCFAWIGVREVLRSTFQGSALSLAVLKTVIVILWIFAIIFVFAFPDMFRDELYKPMFTLEVMAFMTVTIIGAWFALEKKSSLLR